MLFKERLSAKIFSFDVFDTTLIRAVASAKDVFHLMREVLIKDNILPSNLSSIFPFVRRSAEDVARVWAYGTQKREITIAEIYGYIAPIFSLNQDQISYLINLEINMEYQFVHPVASTIDMIKELRRNNRRIVFTSDMYLPLISIKHMLEKIAVYQPEDAIYVSSDIGLKKFDGKLFQYILDKENCSAAQLCHYGDNQHSDVFIPRKLGIQVLPWS